MTFFCLPPLSLARHGSLLVILQPVIQGRAHLIKLLTTCGWMHQLMLGLFFVCCTGAHSRRICNNHFCVMIHHNIILSLRVSREATEFSKLCTIMPKNLTTIAATKLVRGLRPSTISAQAFSPDNDNAVLYIFDGGCFRRLLGQSCLDPPSSGI